MKNLILTIGILISGLSFGQNCEQIYKHCESLLADKKNGTFISDGQVYTAFLDREKAEFNTTFYGGSTYRIAASAGTDENYAIFKVKDELGNIIFSNKDYNNAPYWDFVVPHTLNITIETELDPDQKVTGCVVVLIGFKK